MKKLSLIASLSLFSMALFSVVGHAQVLGLWKTIDDETGEAKSIVEIYEQDGEYRGAVRELLLEADDTRCEQCEGSHKNQPIVGMEIIYDMQKKGDELSGGRILDPESGKVYKAKLWLDGEDRLKVRGYVGFLYRTQTWQRAE